MNRHKHIAINEHVSAVSAHEKMITIEWGETKWELTVCEKKEALIVGVLYKNDRKIYDENGENIMDTIHTEKQSVCKLERKDFAIETPILQIIDALFEHEKTQQNQTLMAQTFTKLNQQMTTLMAKIQDHTQNAAELSEKIEFNLLELFQTLAPAEVYAVNTERDLTLFNCGKSQPKADWSSEEQQKTEAYQTELLSFLAHSKSAPLNRQPPLPPFLERRLTSAMRSLSRVTEYQQLRLEQTDTDRISVTLKKLLGSRDIEDPSGGSDAPKLLDKFCAQKGISAETWTLNLAEGACLEGAQNTCITGQGSCRRRNSY